MIEQVGPQYYADYQCIDEACKATWRGKVGPTRCPKCGGLFAFWTDFDEKWEQRGAGYMPKPEYDAELRKPY